MGDPNDLIDLMTLDLIPKDGSVTGHFKPRQGGSLENPPLCVCIMFTIFVMFLQALILQPMSRPDRNVLFFFFFLCA